MMKQPAGFWIRFLALILDGIIVGIPLLILAYLLTGNWDRADSLSDFFAFLYALIVPVVWKGFTVGKRICNIRIRKEHDHLPPHIGTMLLRGLVATLVYVLTLGIGLIASIIMVAVREDKRGLHDFIAGTEVVYDD